MSAWINFYNSKDKCCLRNLIYKCYSQLKAAMETYEGMSWIKNIFYKDPEEVFNNFEARVSQLRRANYY